MDLPAAPRHYAAVLILMAGAAALIALTGYAPVRVTAPGFALPDTLPGYVTHTLLFCQDPACLRSFRDTDLNGAERCPVCGGPLDTWSPGERRILPRDTAILRRQYVRPGQPPILASIVVSGAEQKSIHRPQQCLPAQGYAIEKTHAISVDRDGQSPLRVTLLELRRTGVSARSNAARHAFAYWFTDGKRETHSTPVRLFWTSVDRVFHRTVRRWAYISLSLAHDGEPHTRLEPLRDLIPALARSSAD